MAIVLSALVAVLWLAGTTLALHGRRGQRFGLRRARLPVSTRLLWCSCPLLLAIAGHAFYGQPRDPARLAIAFVIVLVLLFLTTLVPIPTHNARLK